MDSPSEHSEHNDRQQQGPKQSRVLQPSMGLLIATVISIFLVLAALSVHNPTQDLLPQFPRREQDVTKSRGATGTFPATPEGHTVGVKAPTLTKDDEGKSILKDIVNSDGAVAVLFNRHLRADVPQKVERRVSGRGGNGLSLLKQRGAENMPQVRHLDQSTEENLPSAIVASPYWRKDSQRCEQHVEDFQCPTGTVQGDMEAGGLFIGEVNKKKPRWAVISLLRGKESVSYYRNHVIRRDHLIMEYLKKIGWPSDRPLDFINFHEGNMRESDMELIAAEMPEPHQVIFKDVRELGAFSRPRKAKLDGYKAMCEFFSINFVRALCDYDFYWRMDDDNFLELESTTTDILTYFESDPSIDYGYIMAKWEGHKETIDTLPIFTRGFLEGCGIKPKCGLQVINHQNFYNNFHISKVEPWLRPEVQKYLTHVSWSDGIYRHRWGDSTIQALAAKVFFNPDAIQPIPGVVYEHGSHHRRIVSAERGVISD